MIAVLSDLHLPASPSQLTRDFEALLDELRRQKIAQLWLLGDIFDLLVGDFAFWRDLHAGVLSRIRELKAQGCRVVWLEGNHDFSLEALLAPYGVDVLDGEQTIEVAGKRVFIAHGDLVNPEDLAYLKWRKITRSAGLRRALAYVPNVLAQTLLKPWAESLSRQSRRRNAEPTIDLRSMYRRFADQKFREGFAAVFLGHCHVIDLYRDGKRFYANLGSALDGTLRYALWNPESNDFPKILLYPTMIEWEPKA